MRASQFAVIGRYFAVTIFSLFSFAVFQAVESLAQLYENQDRSWVNEAGGNPFGDSNVNPMADPANNPWADPSINPMADPKYNPLVDPEFNQMADPRNSPLGDAYIRDDGTMGLRSQDEN